METAENNVLSNELIHDEVLTGVVDRPFISKGKLLGAVIRFPERSETALLHVKQMVGVDREKRLAGLKLGEQIRVKLVVSGSKPNRKIWASELELLDDDIVARILAGERKNVPGRVINTTTYGVFVELLGGIASGKRGLIHVKNLYVSQASLSDFTAFSRGKPVNVDISDARIDDRDVLRLDLRISVPEVAQDVAV